MTATLVQQLINGLTVGSLYALMALGLTMVYGVLRVLLYHDMEGLSGQDDPRTIFYRERDLYARGRELLTADVNAVVEGLFAGGADEVHVMDIYPAGEKPLPGVDSGLILRALLRNGAPASAFGGVLETLKELRPGDVFLTLGAGDVWKLGEEIKLKTGMLAQSFQR